MNSLAMAAPKTGFKFMLTVREGPDVGVSYQLLPPRVTIGRGPDCHVALTDPRVSRNAAVIEFSMEKILITDISGRQGMIVNGEPIIQTSIKDSDVIQIGDTQMTFFVEAMPLAPVPPPMYPPMNVPGSHGAIGPAYPPRGASTPPPPPASFSSGGLSSRQKFYIGLGLVGLALVYLLTSETAKKPQEASIRTVEEIEKEIKESETRQEEFTQKRIFKNDEEKARFDEANRHFLEGFRDYQKGQSVRAMRSFETAKTIDPRHPLAARYFKLAEKQRDELIAQLTLEGRRYREKNMFARCSAQFDKVLSLIPNKEDVKYKSAEALKKECDLLLEQRFRY